MDIARSQLIDGMDELSPPGASFPYQSEIFEGESGQGYALRMSCGNGLPGLLHVKQMLHKSHSATLDADDAPYLAQWFGASMPSLEFALEQLVHGRREGGVGYAGQVLGRRYFLTRTHPRVCPDCVRDLGYCRMAWDFALAVACARHRRVLLDHCPTCLRPLSWNRPGLDVCACGCSLSMNDVAQTPEAHELLVAHIIDCRMNDDFSSSWSAEDEAQSHGPEMTWLVALLRNLSMDGMMRVVYGLATAALYAPDDDGARVRGALRKARETMARAVGCGAQLLRTGKSHIEGRRPSVLVDLLSEVSASATASRDDADVARSLLESLLDGPSRSTLRSRHASLSQRVLF